METSFEELLFNCVVWKLLGFGRRDGFAGAVLNTGFFDATEEGVHSLSTEKFASQRRC